MQPDLFHNVPSYPVAPGYRKTDTSRKAAEMVVNTVPMIREQVLNCLKSHPAGLTTEEISQRLGITYAAVQPRTSELRKAGQIIDSQKRRKNSSGRKAIVWQYFSHRGDSC